MRKFEICVLIDGFLKYLYLYFLGKTSKGPWCTNDVQIIWYLGFGRDIQTFWLPGSIGEVMRSAKRSLYSKYANIFINSEETWLNLFCAFLPLVWTEAGFFFLFRAISEYVLIGHNLYSALPLRKMSGSLLTMGVLLSQLSSVSGTFSKALHRSKRLLKNAQALFFLLSLK